MVAVNQIRDEYTLRATSEGIDKVIADGNNLAKSADRVAVSEEKRERRVISVSKAVEEFTRKNDALYRAELQVAKGQELLNRAFEQGLAETTLYARATAALAEKEAQLARAHQVADAAARSATVGRVEATAASAAFSAANDNGAGSLARFARAAALVEPALSKIGLGGLGTALAGGAIVAGVAAVTATVGAIAAAGDAWTRYGNQLQAAGVESSQVAGTQRDLAKLAIETRSSLDSTVGLYARMTRATGDLGVTQSQVMRVTEIIGKDLANSGISAAEAAGGLLQFSQALQAGRLGGDELRSVLENMPTLARAIATEFGVTVGELRELGTEGKLTADRVFQAVLNAGQAVDAAFAKTNPTIAQGVEIAKTGLLQLGAEIDKSTGLSKLLAGGLEGVGRRASEAAEGVDKLRLAAENYRVQNLQAKLSQLEGPETEFAQSLAIPGQTNAEMERVRTEIAATRVLLSEALGDVDRRIDAMVGLPERALRPMSDELRAMEIAAEQAARGLLGTAGAAGAAGNALANASLQARGFTDALNAIQSANPNLSGTISLLGKVDEVNRRAVEGTKGVLQKFAEGGIGDTDAQAQIKRLNDEAATSIKALRTEAEKPFSGYIREADIGKLDTLEQALARAGDRYGEIRQKALDYYQVQIEKASPEARGELERQRTAELGKLDAAFKQVQATERKNAAEKSSGGGAGNDAFDNALQRSKDQIEEFRQQAESAGKASEEVYRLTEANRLRRAAQSAGRADEEGMADLIDKQAAAYARQRKATEEALEGQRRLQEGTRELGQSLTRFLDDFLLGTTSLSSAFASMARGLTSSGLQALLTGQGPLAGMLGTASPDRGQMGGLLGGIAPTFLRDAVSDGARTGTEAGASRGLSGLTDLFGGANGRQLLQGAAGAAMIGGSYSIGRQSRGAAGLIGGAVSGALGGAMLGAELGSGLGPIGAVAGGVIGLVGAPIGHKPSQKKDIDHERSERLRQSRAYRDAHRRQPVHA